MRGGAYGARRQAQQAAAPKQPNLAATPYRQQAYKAKQDAVERVNAQRARGNFMRAAQAEGTLRDVTGMFDASVLPQRLALLDAFNSARLTKMGEQANIDTGGRIARSDRDIKLQALGIDQGVNQADLADIATKLGLNNEQFGLAMRTNQESLANQDIIDQFLNQTRGQNITDIGEAKRKADLGTSIQMGETAGMASGAARLGLFANTKEEQSAQARSEQTLQEGLAQTKFKRKELNWDLERAGMSRRENEIELRSRERALTAEAKKAGLSRKQYELALQSELNKLNLDRVISVGKFADAINKGTVTGIDIDREVSLQRESNPQVRAARRVIARGGRPAARRGGVR